MILLGIALATTAALAWSIMNVLAAQAMRSVRPSTATLVSLVASLLFTIPIAVNRDPDGLLHLSLAAVAWFGATGFFNFGGGRFFSYAAIRHVGASRAMLVRNASPVITAVLAIVLFGERPSLLAIVGGLLVVTGVYVAIEFPTGKAKAPAQSAGSKYQALPGSIVLGYTFALLSAVSYAISSVLARAAVFTQASQWVGVVVALSAGVLVVGVVDARTFDRSVLRWAPPLWLLIGGGVSSGIALLLAYTAYGIAPLSIVIPFANMQPLLTGLIAHVVLGGIERLTPRLGVALALTTVGALLIVAGI